MPETENEQLRALYFREQAVLEAYKDAIKGALESADKAAESVSTAAFSIATAYAALVGLVTPDKAAVAIPVIAPILVFAAAALIALVARSLGVKTALEPNTVDSVSSAISNTIWAKRFGAWVSIAVLMVALGMAGLVVVDGYGGG